MASALTNKTILIVNDDPDMRLFLARIIEDAGGIVATADDVRNGMEMVGRFAPDVIVLDVMIRPDGKLALFDELKQDPLHCRTPVVFVSSMDEMTVSRLSAASSGARPSGILEKPPDAEDLICTLADCINSGTEDHGATP